MYDQIHDDGNPLHRGVVVLLDIGQQRGDRVMIPVKENDGLLLQNDDVGVEELVELQKIVDVVEEVQVGIVVHFGRTDGVVKPVAKNVLHDEVADAQGQAARRDHQKQVVNHHEARKSDGLSFLHDVLENGETHDIPSYHGRYCPL